MWGDVHKGSATFLFVDFRAVSQSNIIESGVFSRGQRIRAFGEMFPGRTRGDLGVSDALEGRRCFDWPNCTLHKSYGMQVVVIQVFSSVNGMLFAVVDRRGRTKRICTNARL